MTLRTTVEVKGIKELNDALMRKIPEHLRAGVVTKALMAGARPIVRSAKDRAQSLDNTIGREKSGTLERAIRAFVVRNPESHEYEVAIRPRSGKKYRKATGGSTDAYYWRFVEFGHRIGTRKTGYLTGKGRKRSNSTGAGFVRPYPFLRPAFAYNKDDALKIIIRSLRKGVNDAAKKASWKTSAAASRASAAEGLQRATRFVGRIRL